jgi:hypothetical protein
MELRRPPALPQNAAALFTSASVSFTASNTALDIDGNRYGSLGLQQAEQSFTTGLVQALSEVAVLVLLVIDILVAAIACARLVVVARLLGVYAASAAATQGRRMLRIVVMAVFAFFAFLLRAVVSTKFMVACMQQELTASTRASDLNKCGRACFNV